MGKQSRTKANRRAEVLAGTYEPAPKKVSVKSIIEMIGTQGLRVTRILHEKNSPVTRIYYTDPDTKAETLGATGKDLKDALTRFNVGVLRPFKEGHNAPSELMRVSDIPGASEFLAALAEHEEANEGDLAPGVIPEAVKENPFEGQPELDLAEVLAKRERGRDANA